MDFLELQHRKDNNSQKVKKKAAFALMEIMVAIGVIGILFVGGSKVADATNKSKYAGVKADFRSYQTAAYNAIYKDEPFTAKAMNDSLDHIMHLDEAKKPGDTDWGISTQKKDPWGTPYRYQIVDDPVDPTKQEIYIVSAGADMKFDDPGTKGDDSVLRVWKDGGAPHFEMDGTVADPQMLPTAIKIVKEATQLEYAPGEYFNPAGMKVEVTYQDGSKAIKTDAAPNLVVPRGELGGGKTEVPIQWKEGGTTLSTTHKVKMISGFAIKSAIDFNNVQNVGTSGKIDLITKFDDGTETIETGTPAFGNWTSSAVGVAKIGTDGKVDFLSSGQATLRYERGKLGVSVNAIVGDNRQIPVSIKVVKAPDVTKYLVGENFNPTGMQIEVTYKDNHKEIKQDGFLITDGNNLTASRTDVTVEWNQGGVKVTTKQPITVIQGLKIEYSGIEGEPVNMGTSAQLSVVEVLRPGATGAVVAGGTWSSSNEAAVTVDQTGKVNFVGVGNAVIKVQKGSLSDIIEFKVEDWSKIPTGIKVITPPTKTKYVEGENFVPDGMKIEVTYKDGHKAPKNWNDPGVAVVGGQNLTKANKDVTVEYSENGVKQSVKLPITVSGMVNVTIKYVSGSGKDLGTSVVSGIEGTSQMVSAKEIAGYTTPTQQKVTFGGTPSEVTFSYQVIEYNVVYEDAGTHLNPATFNVESQEIVLGFPVKEGHTFLGWTGNNGTTPQKTVSIAAGSTGDKNFKANWEVNTVNLNVVKVSDSGKALGTTTITGKWGTSQTVNADPIEGYTAPVAQTVVLGNVAEVKLMYSRVNYTITYENAGNHSNPTTYNVESQDIVLVQPTKSGADFLGWTGSNGTSNQLNVTIAAGSTGNKTFKANWKIQGTPMMNVPEGTPIKLRENGTLVDFYVVKHNYESGLNGAGRTLLLRKNIYAKRSWDGGTNANWRSCDLNVFLNSTYLNLFDPSIIAAIGRTTYYSQNIEGMSTSNQTCSSAIFLPSVTEYGKSYGSAAVEGSRLPNISSFTGADSPTWTRTGKEDNYDVTAFIVSNNGSLLQYGMATKAGGVRPCFTLPNSVAITPEGTVVQLSEK